MINNRGISNPSLNFQNSVADYPLAIFDLLFMTSQSQDQPKASTWESPTSSPSPSPYALPEDRPRQPPASRQPRFPWRIGGILITLILAGLMGYRIWGPSPAKTDILDILTVPVESKNLTVRITASGEVQPVQRVNLSPKTPGRLVALFVEQGDRVSEGEVLAQMESRDIEAQLRQSQARLEQAKARLLKLQTGTRQEAIAAAQSRLVRTQAQLAELRAGIRPEEIAQGQARLNQAKTQLADVASGTLSQEIAQAQARIDANQAEVELATQRLERNRNLLAEGAISQDQFDESLRNERRVQANLEESKRQLQQLHERRRSETERLQALVEQEEQSLKQLETGPRSEQILRAEADVAEAQSQLAELVNGSRTEDIAQAEAEVAEAAAQVRYQQVQLEDTYIRAPFAGIITQRYATQGAFVTPTVSASEVTSATSTSIVALARDLEVLAKVPEADISQIKIGQTVEIVADAYPDQIFQGSVELIAPEAVKEREVTLFQVRVKINQGKDQLQSGMNVDLSFIGNELENALVVPTVAIVTNKGVTGVLIPDAENKPQFQPVTIGSTLGNQIQILQGLETGQRVFVELPPGQKLEDIFKVR